MRLSGIVALLVLVVCLVGCQASDTNQEAPREATPTHYDIGVVQRSVSTASPEAQLWFDRGLGLAYGFNHEEAIRCFERAAEADPDLAMAYWGKAYASGPNYNDMAMTEEKSQTAYDAIQMAVARKGGAGEAEAALMRCARCVRPIPTTRTSRR
jgi:tetratricopeptide (TPR) repeat protein